MVQRMTDMERARDIGWGNHNAVWLTGMSRGGMEITLLVPDLGPTCFNRLGVVCFVELRGAHVLYLVWQDMSAGFFQHPAWDTAHLSMRVVASQGEARDILSLSSRMMEKPSSKAAASQRLRRTVVRTLRP